MNLETNQYDLRYRLPKSYLWIRFGQVHVCKPEICTNTFTVSNITLCVSINKTQVETLRRIYICLSQLVFSHGQLYVAVSWVRFYKNLKVQIS